MDYKRQDNHLKYTKAAYRTTSHKGFSGVGNTKIMMSIFTLLNLFLLGIFLPRNISAYSHEHYRNTFYVRVINQTMSYVKASVTEPIGRDEELNVKSTLLSLMGIDVKNPLSILGKEVSYLKQKEIGNVMVLNPKQEKKEVGFQPFNLGEKEISKIDPKEAQETSNQVANVYDPKLKKTLNKAKPEILIYHSHTCESYTGSAEKSNQSNTTNSNLNITAVGEKLKHELEENYGVAVIHDQTIHDKADYRQAYKKSGATLDKYLKQYGDFKVIIDLHRDSIKDKKNVTMKINGEEVAKYMFVMAKENPHFKKNMEVVEQIVSISNNLYPGLSRGTGVYYYNKGMDYFNQTKSNHAVLMELGTYSNNLQEAKNACKYLARIIAEYLNGKEKKNHN